MVFRPTVQPLWRVTASNRWEGCSKSGWPWHSNKTVRPATANGWGQRVRHRNVLYSGQWWHNHQGEGVDEDLWWAAQRRKLFFGETFLFRVKCHPIRPFKWPVASARSVPFIARCDEWPNSRSKYHSRRWRVTWRVQGGGVELCNLGSSLPLPCNFGSNLILEYLIYFNLIVPYQHKTKWFSNKRSWPSSPPHWLSRKRNKAHVKLPRVSYFINFVGSYRPGGLMASVLILCWMDSHELPWALCSILGVCIFFVRLQFRFSMCFWLLFTSYWHFILPFVLLWFWLDINPSGWLKIALTGH